MSTKTIIAALIAVAVCLGVTISGCKRDRATAMRGGVRNQARPAEVLASTATRVPVQAAVYTQPLPPAPPVHHYQQVPIIIYPTPDLAVAEAVRPAPAVVRAPAVPTPAPAPRYRPAPAAAPIPELEPSRYTAHAPTPAPTPARTQQATTALRPLQPMYTPASTPMPSVQNEIRPLAWQGRWVASPTTAMRSGY